MKVRILVVGCTMMVASVALAQEPALDPNAAAVELVAPAAQPAEKDYGIVIKPSDRPVMVQWTEAGYRVAYEDNPVRINADRNGGMVSLDLFKLKRFAAQPVASTAVALSYAAIGYGIYQLGNEQGWWGDEGESRDAAVPETPDTVNGDYVYIAAGGNVSYVQAVNNGEGQEVGSSQSDAGQ